MHSTIRDYRWSVPQQLSLRNLMFVIAGIAIALAARFNPDRSIRYAESASSHVVYEWQSPRFSKRTHYSSWVGSTPRVSMEFSWSGDAREPDLNTIDYILGQDRRQMVHTVLFDPTAFDQVDIDTLSETLADFPKIQNVFVFGVELPVGDGFRISNAYKQRVRLRSERIAHLKETLNGRANVAWHPTLNVRNITK